MTPRWRAEDPGNMLTNTDLQRLIDLSPAVHYIAHASGDCRTVYVSAGVQNQLGYPAEQFTSDPGFWASRIHPEDRPGALAGLAAIFEDDRHVHEYRFQHADGEWRWIHDKSVLVRDHDGNPCQIVGSWFDITERRSAEDTHAKLAMRLKEAQWIASLGSWEFNTTTSEQWWSDETYRILGDSLPGAGNPSSDYLLQILHPDDRERFLETIQRALADGKPYSIDYRIVLADGTEKVINGRGYAVGPSESPATRFAGTIQDITARTRTEQALRAAEERNRALLEANPDVIFRIDADGRYLDLSVSSRTQFPYTREEIVGRRVEDLFSEDFAHEQSRHVDKAIETGETQLWECQMTFGDVKVDLEARFVRSGDNEVVVTVRNVTERLALQREIIATQERERGRIGQDLHDSLGQELTGVSLGLEVLSRTLERERSPHTASLQNLKAMTQKSISETRRIARSLSPGFWSDFGIAAALESLAREVNEHTDVQCRAECSGKHDQHTIELDTNLYRIAQESVTNALKHGKPTSIEMRYRCDGETIELEVLDDGIGIPPTEDVAEGMGLKSMRYRTRLLSGNLELSARAGGGTRVSLCCRCQI